MYKSFLSLAAAATVAVFAGSGPTAAADRTLAAGVNDQQNVSEEFSSQRRWRRGRVVVIRSGYWAPRYRRAFWGPRYRSAYWGPRYRYWGGPYAYPVSYGYPYAAYAYPYAAYGYPYYYRRPFVSVGFGGFGFRFW